MRISWGQTPSEVTIYSLLPPGYGKAEVRVQATGDQLTLFKRAPEDTTGEERIHLIVDFWKPVSKLSGRNVVAKETHL